MATRVNATHSVVTWCPEHGTVTMPSDSPEIGEIRARAGLALRQGRYGEDGVCCSAMRFRRPEHKRPSRAKGQ